MEKVFKNIKNLAQRANGLNSIPNDCYVVALIAKNADDEPLGFISSWIQCDLVTGAESRCSCLESALSYYEDLGCAESVAENARKSLSKYLSRTSTDIVVVSTQDAVDFFKLC